MIISIDYDDTYTRDRELWDNFIRQCLLKGHEVWCVSARHDFYMKEVRKSVGRIIGDSRCLGTNGKAKRAFLFEEKGVYADVWIDDNPDTVDTDYETGWVTQYGN